MRLLLDTHVVLWWLNADRRLSAAARDAVAAADGEVLVSTASVWEMAIKAGLGRLRLPDDTGGFLADQFRANRFKVLPVGLDHAAAVRGLPGHHKDPFDRLLVAQALIEGATLVTQDAALRAYPVACVG